MRCSPFEVELGLGASTLAGRDGSAAGLAEACGCEPADWSKKPLLMLKFHSDALEAGLKSLLGWARDELAKKPVRT